MVLSTSPNSVSYIAYDTAYCEEINQDAGSPSLVSTGRITLSEFIHELRPILHKQKESAQQSLQERVRQDEMRGTKDDPVNELFSRLDLSLGEWKRYRLFDPMKNYTRNLIATDDETFTLLLLCWNANKSSPIHDHP